MNLCRSVDVDVFQLRQIKLPHLRLIRNRQRLIQLPCASNPALRLSAYSIFQHSGRTAPRQTPEREFLCGPTASGTAPPFRARTPAPLRLAASQTPAAFSILIAACSNPTVIYLNQIFWSGRRESNPRPTAWKAVTLPLSYSRPDINSASLSAPADSAAQRSFDRYSPRPLAGLTTPYSRTKHVTILEPMIRIELMTSPLPRECSTN